MRCCINPMVWEPHFFGSRNWLLPIGSRFLQTGYRQKRPPHNQADYDGQRNRYVIDHQTSPPNNYGFFDNIKIVISEYIHILYLLLTVIEFHLEFLISIDGIRLRNIVDLWI